MNLLGDEFTSIGFPIVHVPLVLEETIRHVRSIEYVHCLLDLNVYNMISISKVTINGESEGTQSKK